MFRRSAGLATLAVLALLLAAASASAARPSRTYFPLDHLPLAHATSLGAASPSQTMQIGIGLKDPNTAAEQALMAAQQNPAGPQYDHFLTPARYDARFGVARTTFSRALTWLRGGGATVIDTSGARDFIEIQATVAQIDKLFHVTIGGYQSQGVHFLANSAGPSVPAGLHVLTVMGLNTLVHPTTPLAGAHRGDPAPGSSVLGKPADPAALSSIPREGGLVDSITSALGSAVLGVAPVTAPAGGVLTTVTGAATSAVPNAGTPEIPAELTPQQLWSVYDMPSDNTGQGQSVAVMGAGDSSTTVKDLAVFESEHGLPAVPVKVTDIPADGDFSDTSGNVEWELDTQASTGMAPDVKQVHLYFSEHLTDPDAEADFARWVDDPHGPKQANASFGECETTPANATLESTIPTQFNNNEDQNALYGTGAPDALEPVADQTLRQGVLEGRTLFAATGDTGSSCPVLVLGPELGAGNGVVNQGVPIVNYPAASPFVVAVGGTVLYPDSDNTRGLEYPWPYTGGGQSFFIPAPSWQSGVSNIDRPCLSDVSGNPNTSLGTCRGIPDVADESGDIATSSYDIYSDELGGASSEGGTSLASPLMMGMWTRIQAASRRGTGFADPLLYAVGKSSAEDAQAFNDYEIGTNGAYQAEPGWDYVSGWGTPILTPLMQDIDNRTAPIQNG
ncbi:MAG TPA: S53 family peptidase [Solirubrobacteraceae bacterium]|jgi:subtilase family serine protease|nr:S53 family peptidase [Solirubrobacteraceae bacterium]